MVHIQVPIEAVFLPRKLRQSLINSEFFLFPPTMKSLENSCIAVGIPVQEAALFVSDNRLVASSAGYEYIRSSDIYMKTLFSNRIVNIVGPPSSGKTYYCMAAANSILKTQSSRVIYIDCDGGFAPSLLDAGNPSCEGHSQFSLLRVHDWMGLVSAILLLLDDRKRDFSLVVVDSVASLMRHAECGGQIGRERILKVFCDYLRRLKCTVLIVNQTTTKIIDNQDGEGSLVPCMGRTYAHALGTSVETIELQQRG